ncbi:ADP-ribosylglycohydrolase family protein [Desulfobacterales bacterium HSG16]|nr:ADP-ribosylglycohydrolase family protein [Desulfobacterales bacterium HSG16]
MILSDRQNKFRGLILGTAAGDAIGLALEGMSKKKVQRKLKNNGLDHRLIPLLKTSYSMVSDDTEHTLFVAQSLIAHPDSPSNFKKRLSWCFRWWLISLPAGVGFATLRAICRLWLGFLPLSGSGVFSAGNGPAMRAAPIGAFFSDAPHKVSSYIKVCTQITHTDPKAETGAMAVASIAAWIINEQLANRPDLKTFISFLHQIENEDEEWKNIVNLMADALDANCPVSIFADQMGLSKGITGYIYHTVPVVLYAWYQHFGSYKDTVSSVIECGGDTDTTAAIAGALAGAVTGERGIPGNWIANIIEWPRSVGVMIKIADTLEKTSTRKSSGEPVSYFWPGVIPRNLFFLFIVLIHGFLRLLPPY